MLTNQDVEQLFAQWHTPEAGRRLIRRIRSSEPARNLQWRTDGVRTRFISEKMGGRALLAESRTCEFPALYMREHDQETLEYWPQPCTVDMLPVGPNGGTTRVRHTPDLFVIARGFVIEEWREFERLERLVREQPHRFYRGGDGTWHFVPAEQHFKELGIEYCLRCADEHPRSWLANLRFLEDYSLSTAPPVPNDVRVRLKQLFDINAAIPHLALVRTHGIQADHVFQLLLEGTSIYVDFHNVVLHKTDDLIIYRNKDISRAAQLLAARSRELLSASTLQLTVGSRVIFDGRALEVQLVGTSKVTMRDIESGQSSTLDVDLVRSMFEGSDLVPASPQSLELNFDKDAFFNDKRLGEGLSRLELLQEGGKGIVSERTIRRWKAQIRGLSFPPDQIRALTSHYPGNTNPRLPDECYQLARAAIERFHNQPACPRTTASYSVYQTDCEAAGVRPMSLRSFYGFVARFENVLAREGHRKEYQKAPIPLTLDHDHPVHGVLPHEVCYCDHTIVNIMLKGITQPNLGKPTLTLMMDGSLSKARAFYLSYEPANAAAVLMCLRDYVRRNGRLPKVLVLDNGREFHSHSLQRFCDLFGIEIRWRRRSKPRDSTLVERALGATEVEVISSMSGNSIALKDPRTVPMSHQPEGHIEWTLPGLHGSIEHYLFDLHPNRAHPRFGMSPVEWEKRLTLELGARSHIFVRFDPLFMLLTAPSPSGRPTRSVDPQRGVFVDGIWYWADVLARAKPRELAEVRVERWAARVVYVCFREEWVVAQARDGGLLNGRYRTEFEEQLRRERRARRTAAAKDKVSMKNAIKRTELWDAGKWDKRLQEQMAEMHYLYDRLGMTECMPAAKAMAITDRFSAQPALLDDPVDDDVVEAPDRVVDMPTVPVHATMAIAAHEDEGDAAVFF